MTQTTKQTMVSITLAGLFLALFLALPNDSHAAVGASSTKPVEQVKNLSCVQAAVLERETNVMEAWTTFNTAMVAALTKRSDALVAAWKMPTIKERSVALKALWTTWKADSKKAHSEMKTDRKEAWTGFRKTMKEECQEAKLPKEDVEPRDASGAATI